MKKLISAILIAAATAVVFVSCAEADVVKKYGRKSFDKLVEKFPAIVSNNTDVDNYYTITADGSTFLKVSNNYKQTGAEDIVIVTDAAPFVAAGLDVSKLPAGYRVQEDKLFVTADYGEGKGATTTLADSLFESVDYDRKVLTYHTELDHYGITLPGGKFEYAKDYAKNDKDIVFVIGAKPLADLKVNVQSIEGWVFKTMKDEMGNDVDVLLKPYDLK